MLQFYQKEKFHGDKTRKELVKYALQHTKVRVFELWSGNFEGTVNQNENGLPWLISYCGEGGGKITLISIPIGSHYKTANLQSIFLAFPYISKFASLVSF